MSLTGANITIAGAVTDGGAGTVGLIATGGTIGETGTLIAGTLSGGSTGTTMLTGASADDEPDRRLWATSPPRWASSLNDGESVAVARRRSTAAPRRPSPMQRAALGWRWHHRRGGEPDGGEHRDPGSGDGWRGRDGQSYFDRRADQRNRDSDRRDPVRLGNSTGATTLTGASLDGQPGLVGIGDFTAAGLLR